MWQKSYMCILQESKYVLEEQKQVKIHDTTIEVEAWI